MALKLKPKPPAEKLLKTVYSAEPSMFYDHCTKPIDGEDPKVYSKKVPYSPLSYLNLGTSIKPEEDNSTYLSKAPPPTCLDAKELYIDCNVSKEQSKKYWEVESDGRLLYVDQEMIKQSEGVFGEMVKKFTKSIFMSNVYGMSLPVRINECRSFSDRVADFFRMVPVYLKKASMMSDPIERIKLYTVHVICSLNFALSRSKTFNPLLGETCQAGLQDGTEIFVEQVSHHPPIAAYQVIAKDFTMHGHCHLEAKFKLGDSEIYQRVNQTITFKDGHKLSFVVCPVIKMVGMATNKRRMYMKNKLELVDKKSGIKSVVFFNILNEGKHAKRYDAVDGIIYKVKASAPPSTGKEKCIKDLQDIDTEIARVTGLWTSYVEINGICYWKIEDSKPLDIIFANNPLPSDVRFREDIIWLKRKNIPYADAWKDSIEIRQRKDRALRQKYFPDYV